MNEVAKKNEENVFEGRFDRAEQLLPDLKRNVFFFKESFPVGFECAVTICKFGLTILTFATSSKLGLA